jgi:catechol 2,3-dioxygenase-like lactoylglutathione lyase family enzyme
MILGIHHTAISTPDFERALAFYRDLLGFEEMMNGGWPKGIESIDRLIGLRDSSARMAMLKLRNAMLEIFEFASPAPKPGDPDRPVNDCGLTHICLHVSGIDDEYQRLRNAGMRFHSPPLDAGPTRCCYGRDPDGNVIELLEFTRPDDPLRL